MDNARLIIAKELIEILAKHPCISVGTEPDNLDAFAVKKIIEAARINYVLPSYCAERNTRVRKCIECIVDQVPPEVCRKKSDDLPLDDLDIEWEVL
jgi:hypothetical protein